MLVTRLHLFLITYAYSLLLVQAVDTKWDMYLFKAAADQDFYHLRHWVLFLMPAGTTNQFGISIEATINNDGLSYRRKIVKPGSPKPETEGARLKKVEREPEWELTMLKQSISSAQKDKILTLAESVESCQTQQLRANHDTARTLSLTSWKPPIYEFRRESSQLSNKTWSRLMKMRKFMNLKQTTSVAIYPQGWCKFVPYLNARLIQLYWLNLD